MTFRPVMMWWRPAADSLTFHQLHLEVAPAEVRAVQWIQRGLTVGCLAALVVVGWWGWNSRAVDETAAAYERSTVRIERATNEFVEQMRQNRLVFSQEQVAAIREQVAFANQLSEKRSFSWTKLLSDLEATLPPHVALVNIKLDFQDSAVVLEGTAVRLQDVNVFITQLHAHQAFRHAVLEKHEIRHETGEQQVAGDAAIEFRLSVRYHPML
ncbi:MAG: hypothetical protein BVN28_04870 [Nitrospira sp. ST-bin4]|nr:MAG: hypothetical protein BVN28_04870 [Nitrospira sp. ST-bin4]